MKLVFCFVFLFSSLLSWAQNKQLLYNVDGLPQTLMSNPGATIAFDGHFGFPFLSQIHFSAGSTGVNIHDIFSSSDSNINSRVRNTIRRMTQNDYFTAQEQLEIISFGFRLNKDHYVSAGVYQELDLFVNFPKDPALLISEGNSEYINVPFDFSHVAFTGEVMTVYHLGLNKKVDRRLTVGGRVKLYSGIFNVESTNNTGMFITSRTPGGENYFRHNVENLNIRVNTSGFASVRDRTSTVQEATANLLKNSMLGGNIGAGIDLGATYVLNENMIATGSVQDVGIMFQQQDVENYLYYGSYQTDGIEPLFPDVGESGETLPYWDIFEDEVDANLIDETLNESYLTWRPFKVNASIRYGFGYAFAPCNYLRPTVRRFENAVGLHLFGINRPGGIKYAMSGFYDRKFSETFRMKLTYTLDKFSYTNVGLMASTRFKSLNFYLAADNLFGYFNLAKSHYASVQLGLQFIFKKK